MPYHDDLLNQAIDLIHKDWSNPIQADLRRAVSTAYYALFHLLISETTLNWSRDSSRDLLGRMFEHNVMRRASSRVLDSRLFPYTGEDPALVLKLRTLAKSFIQLQDKRNIADYHNGVSWTPVESEEVVTTAGQAFGIWASIKNENIAQEYLVSLLIKPRD